ncbi:uncharacterized protein IUM83_02442 [Phytophthora cinnamomi]|uniref:uncharacterized protein n=1 Tax=Phytophthora cinnamomi TaxID=4785 RepID=UPI00355A8BCE|nr:hypothetical protein IUM83_02442 [Phytophthora cinnamomi]
MKRAAPDQDHRLRKAKQSRPAEPAGDVSGPEVERLKFARFPAAITSLPHVLNSITTFLMSPEEAVVEAANTNQLKWLRSLLGSTGIRSGM